MSVIVKSPETTKRKALKASASMLGLAVSAIGWSGLAHAASDENGLQTLLLPDHYRLMDDGVVVFKLEGGEELSLNPDQYVILQDGLLLITDELAQASMESLPVMGAIRSQLMSDVQPIRSPDGSVILASDASPLWSGDGPAPRLFEEVDIERYELAQNSSETQTQPEANLGQAAGAAAGGILAGLSLLSSILGTKPEQETEETTEDAPVGPYTGPARGFVINGIETGDFMGTSVSSAGDINNDGYDDIIIGAYGADTGKGEAYVVFGKDTSFPAALDLSALDGNNGFVINGIDAGDFSGKSVSSAGDINNDGYDDIIIGADGADTNTGASYVVFGKDTSFPAALDLSALDGNNGFVINGIDETDYSGYSVSSAGDINNDGYDDIIIGAWGPDNGAGESYVVFGKETGYSASLDPSSLNGTNGFVINGIDAGDFSGYSVSSAGDINNDEYDDIIIGAHAADNYTGASYVVFGKDTSFPAALDLSALDGNNGFVMNGIDAADASGYSVSSAGDINNDGYDDIIIGAYGADTGKGEAYVVFGKDTSFPAALDLSALDGNNGFVINGIDAGDASGYSVSSAGDINNDEYDDIIIGAYGADNYTGESYVVFGKETSYSASLDLSALDGNNGFVINGIDEIDYSGSRVSSAGDINNDGYDDIIIAAFLADNFAGESHVVFGQSEFDAFVNLSDLALLA